MDTYKQINLTEYVQTGEGGNGKTYVTSAFDSDEILKVNNARLKHMGSREARIRCFQGCCQSRNSCTRDVSHRTGRRCIRHHLAAHQGQRNPSHASATTNPSAPKRWQALVPQREGTIPLSLATPNSSPAGRHRHYWPLRGSLL